MRKTLLHFLAERGYYLKNFCGRGICKKCEIVFNNKKVLACQTEISKIRSSEKLLKAIKLSPSFLYFFDKKFDTSDCVAIDLGTTNIRISYQKKKRFIKKIFTNPHFLFASDIFSRINIYPLLKKYPLIEYLKIKELKKGIIVGNPIMYHFLLNKISSSLGRYPYKMLIPIGEVIYPIENRKEVQMVPIISSFIGGDIVAGILYTNLHKRKSFSLLIDLGTNGEIVLGNRDKIFASSCAAGPAFEERFHYYGFKIISYLAYLLKEKKVDKSGRLKEKNSWLSQKDIRELQLAKSAIASGIIILSQFSQIPLNQIERVYLTGNFGAKINPRDLYTLGILSKEINGEIFSFPDLPLKGAEKILKENSLMKECLEIVKKTETFFLPEIKEFSKIFINQISFP
ncbi:MAG: ASKHA domain-containing protein [candidate division WOR-3 bacterium]|nr:ASKHA domain-containing protein [candidate division WOR-3 bacterium]MCX7837669.1 ASKHA domain-containing protein [candidate division WOR-3 bacterium]